MKGTISLLALLVLTPFILVGCGKNNTSISPSPSPTINTPTTIPVEKLSFASGSKNGSYYKAAEELNEVLKKAGFRIVNKESYGSIENIEAVGKGEAEIAFAQIDAIELLQKFTDEETQKIANNVQYFAPINNEVIHIIVNKSSGIKNLADLKGKKVSIGPKKSGTSASAFAIYQLHNALDFEKEKVNIVNLPIEESIEKVASGAIDASFYTSKLGAPLLKEISAAYGQNLEILPVDPSFIPKGVNWYVPEKIPTSTYPWQQKEVSTISTFSFIVVNKSLETEKVYKLAKTVYGQASELKAKNPFWNLLSTNEAGRDIYSGLEYHLGVKKLLCEENSERCQNTPEEAVNSTSI